MSTKVAATKAQQHQNITFQKSQKKKNSKDHQRTINGQQD
jgi:hypothetical protein